MMGHFQTSLSKTRDATYAGNNLNYTVKFAPEASQRI